MHRQVRDVKIDAKLSVISQMIPADIAEVPWAIST